MPTRQLVNKAWINPIKNQFFSNNECCVRSINNAPRGAVMVIPMTATDKISGPVFKPTAKGTAPMAACTVAFGK